MSKSIFDQYKLVSVGTLSESQFLRSVRKTLPKFISPTTCFKDAVTILKNKGIITESKDEDPMGYGMGNDWCDPNEYDLGMRYELGEGMDEEKANKTVYKNLKDNKHYYSQLHLAGYNKDAMKSDRKTHTDLEIPVKKDNFVDVANGTKKIKMDKLTEEELKVMIGGILNEIENSKQETTTIGDLQFGTNVVDGDALPNPNSDSMTPIKSEKNLNDWKSNKKSELEVIIDRTQPWYSKFIIPVFNKGIDQVLNSKSVDYQSSNSRYKGD
jgi:hypothetical protein